MGVARLLWPSPTAKFVNWRCCCSELSQCLPSCPRQRLSGALQVSLRSGERLSSVPSMSLACAAASPQGQVGVPMPQQVSEQQLHGVILAGAPGTSGSWDGGRPSAARALRFPHAHAWPHGGSPVAGHRPQKAAVTWSAGRDGDAAGTQMASMIDVTAEVWYGSTFLHHHPPTIACLLFICLERQQPLYRDCWHVPPQGAFVALLQSLSATACRADRPLHRVV